MLFSNEQLVVPIRLVVLVINSLEFFIRKLLCPLFFNCGKKSLKNVKVFLSINSGVISFVLVTVGIVGICCVLII